MKGHFDKVPKNKVSEAEVGLLDHIKANYDIGNSASLGYDPIVELNAYGHKILNVHVKDRKLKGTTVPLGSGDANIKLVFSKLSHFG